VKKATFPCAVAVLSWCVTSRHGVSIFGMVCQFCAMVCQFCCGVSILPLWCVTFRHGVSLFGMVCQFCAMVCHFSVWCVNSRHGVSVRTMVVNQIVFEQQHHNVQCFTHDRLLILWILALANALTMSSRPFSNYFTRSRSWPRFCLSFTSEGVDAKRTRFASYI
jgi:hypothetical protein